MESISEKKKAIFESTLELIKEHGFHGAPMSLVAKNAGVAAGTIYHYFESKDQLIYELFEFNQNNMIDVVNKALEEKKSYKEKFFNIWMRIYEFYTAHPNVLIFFEQYVNSPYNVNKSHDQFRDRPLYNFLLEGIETGQIKAAKPEVLLVLTIGSITSVAKLSSFGNILVGQADLIKIAEVLWDGMVKR